LNTSCSVVHYDSESGEYKDVQVESLATWWWENGSKKTERYYKNGLEDGLENGFRKEWNEDRKLTLEGNFVDGVEEIN